jgi:RNA polymerase sigma factor (sigma-70 family)
MVMDIAIVDEDDVTSRQVFFSLSLSVGFCHLGNIDRQSAFIGHEVFSVTADLAQQPDHVLVERCRKGDEQAFEVIYNRYRLPLFSYLHKLLPGNNPLVDDIFQQVWLKVVTNWQNYREQQRLLAWICRIAHNLVMDHYRRQGRAEMVELTDNLASSYTSAQEEIDNSLLESALEKATERLSPDQREVFLLRKQGVSFKEIAEIQKANLNTVLGRMHYAVRKVREMLTEFM